MNKLIDAPCESNTNAIAEEHVSSENIYFDIVFVVDDEVGIQSTLLSKPSNKFSLFKK